MFIEAVNEDKAMEYEEHERTKDIFKEFFPSESKTSTQIFKQGQKIRFNHRKNNYEWLKSA